MDGSARGEYRHPSIYKKYVSNTSIQRRNYDQKDHTRRPPCDIGLVPSKNTLVQPILPCGFDVENGSLILALN